MEYRCFPVGHLQTNCYLLYRPGSSACLVIDPGGHAPELYDFIAAEGLQPAAVLLTHGHIDHTGGVEELRRRWPCPIWMHAEDAPLLSTPINREFAVMLGVPLPPPPSRLLSDGEVLTIEGQEMRVIHTPGHTPGSLVLQCGELLFTGDTLFQGSVGRTDLPGGDFAALQRSLARLKTLPPESLVLPGHGDPSTLQLEITYNPYME